MGALDKISGFKLFNTEYAKTAYAKVASSTSNIKGQDEQFALQGWKFTQPDILPSGYNTITAGFNPLQDNGLLNLQGKYDEFGQAPKRTMCFVG